MVIALIAPSYLSAHSSVLESVRRQLMLHITQFTKCPEQRNLVAVLDKSFWRQTRATCNIIRKLWEKNTSGIFFLIKYDQPVKIRHQMENVLQNLFQFNRSIPAMPICFFIHGEHKVGRKEKSRIKSLFKLLLAQQNLPYSMVSSR